jgi:hypothetical protein
MTCERGAAWKACAAERFRVFAAPMPGMKKWLAGLGLIGLLGWTAIVIWAQELYKDVLKETGASHATGILKTITGWHGWAIWGPWLMVFLWGVVIGLSFQEVRIWFWRRADDLHAARAVRHSDLADRCGEVAARLDEAVRTKKYAGVGPSLVSLLEKLSREGLALDYSHTQQVRSLIDALRQMDAYLRDGEFDLAKRAAEMFNDYVASRVWPCTS